jgi:hypothetical protein
MTHELGPVSPLMQPIYLRNIEYRTTHFIHQLYRSNSPHGGKYHQHSHFIRLLKSLETYYVYEEQGDILMLPSYKKALEIYPDMGQINENNALREAFRAINNHTLYLVSATIQVALTHHLDDEISKQTSVAANTATARQLIQKSDPLPSELTLRDVKAFAELGQIWGIPPHIVQQETAKYIDTRYGINLRPLLLAAPAQQSIKDDEKMLEPTDLAKALGFSSGMLLNAHLHAIGWQIPKIGGGFEATPAGKPYCTTHAWVAGNKSGYNYKWNLEAVRDILWQHGRLPETPPQQEQLPI